MRVRTFLLAVVLLLGAGTSARAQSIPSDIPDEPESLDEKNDERLTERHRAFLSRLFAGSSVGLALPAFNVASGSVVQAGGGLLLSGGDAIYGMVRTYRVVASEPSAASLEETEAVYELAVRYEKSLRGVVDAPWWGRRLSVAFGAGVLLGEVDGLSLTVTPQLTLPISRYWSVPLGVTIGSALVTHGPRYLFVGAHVGVRVYLFAFLHEQME